MTRLGQYENSCNTPLEDFLAAIFIVYKYSKIIQDSLFIFFDLLYFPKNQITCQKCLFSYCKTEETFMGFPSYDSSYIALVLFSSNQCYIQNRLLFRA